MLSVDWKNWNTRSHLYQRKISDFIKRHRTVKILHLFRHYSAHVVVVCSALLVAATNVAAGKGSNNFLFGYWEDDQKEVSENNRITAQENRRNDLALVPLSKANTAVDMEAQEEENLEPIIQEKSILTAVSGTNIVKEPEQDGGVQLYTVKEGDTVSGIATAHGITINTILWANDIDNVDSIMPGDVIFILPVAGLNYVAKEGDTIEDIAEKYKADKDRIIAFNDLPANGDIEEGREIIIPDGQGESSYWEIKEEQDALARRQYANSSGGTPQISGWKDLTGTPGTGHRFPYGYCTWYVSQKRYVPWSGNAGTWLYRAKALGYKTGKEPKVGSIVVTTEDPYYGHVAFVEKVKGNTITVSEMNYVGWGKTSKRTLSANSRAIKGFIY